MTAPLHHVNQVILHLPALGGFMAAQSAAGEELRRLTLQAEVRELHREVVEVVAEMNRGAATDRIRPDLDHDRRRSFRPRDRRRADPEEPVSFSLEAEPVVDLRV